jgi:hypothetical protein
MLEPKEWDISLFGKYKKYSGYIDLKFYLNIIIKNPRRL